MRKMKQVLSAPGLLALTRRCFAKIPDTVRHPTYSLQDCLMAGLAVFGLKYPSLLQFDQDKAIVQHNLQKLYGVTAVPCDTSMRERLDTVPPALLGRAFKAIFAQLQRGKVLEQYVYYQNHYLVSLDGTGYFSSPAVHCANCCEKHFANGKTTYYHQLLAAVLLHPDHKVVLPFCPEPIMKQDGHQKNDCERNAAKRLLCRLRRQHPHLKLLVVQDALASYEPHIALLRSLQMHYLLGVKPGSHAYLFEFARAAKGGRHEQCDKAGTWHRYYFVNGLPLNDEKAHCTVNFLDYEEETATGKHQHFTWITDIPLTRDNVHQLMRGGRARWKIENETFNTLKNQGYHFEHNFGHGYQYLSTVFAYLMMLAFLIDQAQQYCCSLFQAAWKRNYSKRYLWDNLRGFFKKYFIDSWETLYRALIHGHQMTPLVPNTS